MRHRIPKRGLIAAVASASSLCARRRGGPFVGADKVTVLAVPGGGQPVCAKRIPKERFTCCSTRRTGRNMQSPPIAEKHSARSRSSRAIAKRRVEVFRLRHGRRWESSPRCALHQCLEAEAAQGRVGLFLRASRRRGSNLLSGPKHQSQTERGLLAGRRRQGQRDRVLAVRQAVCERLARRQQDVRFPPSRSIPRSIPATVAPPAPSMERTDCWPCCIARRRTTARYVSCLVGSAAKSSAANSGQQYDVENRRLPDEQLCDHARSRGFRGRLANAQRGLLRSSGWQRHAANAGGSSDSRDKRHAQRHAGLDRGRRRHTRGLEKGRTTPLATL